MESAPSKLHPPCSAVRPREAPLTSPRTRYPAGSVACSENTEEPGIKKGSQHFLFAIATNSTIDVGFVVATLVPYVLLYICGENHLRLVWRLSLGLGCVFPIILLCFRTRMVESTRFVKSSMSRGPMPYKLILKRYWKSFLGLSVSWFRKPSTPTRETSGRHRGLGARVGR